MRNADYTDFRTEITQIFSSTTLKCAVTPFSRKYGTSQISRYTLKCALLLLLLLLLITLSPYHLITRLSAQQGGKFVFAQLKYSDNWDTRPTAWDRISEFLTMSTSVKSIQERQIITISDDELFWLPFLVITGDSDFGKFTEDEIKTIVRYIQCGGMIFIDDSSGKKGSGFDKAIRDTANKISPENPLEKISLTDAMFKSFYLLRDISGRIITNRYFEGCKIGDRYSIIYSQNDLLGAWEKDNLGNYIYPCDDKQRWEAKKMTINIIIYALTGTYKSDTIHLPFIKSKLK